MHFRVSNIVSQSSVSRLMIPAAVSLRNPKQKEVGERATGTNSSHINRSGSTHCPCVAHRARVAPSIRHVLLDAVLLGRTEPRAYDNCDSPVALTETEAFA